MFPCHRGHTQAVPQVGNLSPCLSVKLSLNHLKPNPYQIQGFQLHLDQSHTHPSLKYAVNDATQGSWLKLWDTALDYGAAGTHQALAILQGLTTPLFGDRKCPLPQLVHISCDRKYKHTPWPHHGTPLGKCPLSHPRNPQTSHRQSWKGSASWPAHSQNSVYTLFRLLNIFASICY